MPYERGGDPDSRSENGQPDAPPIAARKGPQREKKEDQRLVVR
jgi:hypothetical protein